MTQAEQEQFKTHCGGWGRRVRAVVVRQYSLPKKNQRGERTGDGKKNNNKAGVSIHFPQFSAEQHPGEHCLFLL